MHSNKREKIKNEQAKNSSLVNNVNKGLDNHRQQRSLNVVVKPPHAKAAHQVIELCNSPDLNQMFQNNLNNILHHHHHQQQQQKQLRQQQNCNFVVENNKQSKPKHSTKLLSSKSLSQFVQKGFFFRVTKQQAADVGGQKEQEKQQKLLTTKSLPNCPTISLVESSTTKGLDLVNSNASRIPKQISSMHLTRHSTRNSFEPQSNTIIAGNSIINSTIDQPNVSPILASKNDGPLNVDAFVMSPTTDTTADAQKSHSSSQDTAKTINKDDDNKMSPREGAENKDCQLVDIPKKKSKLKNTKLILRDVKNSISLRMRAKQDSQAFTKLTNELATPPTKLYSPFNIYLDSCSKDSKRKLHMDRNKVERDQSMLAISGNSSNGGGGGHFNSSMQMDCDDDDNYYCYDGDEDINNVRHFETPAKRRIALQHKKHLIQANKFTFDSPTGRFRETVKDVEQFQQCIEDISKAIRARDTVGQ